MALYHVYRPQNFSEIIGQEHIVKTLSNQIKNNHTAHAYLFFGPRGTGKTTTARVFAKALNCKNKNHTFEPCNQCDSCVSITQGRAIDVIEIDAASHTGVDHVREHIIENAQFRPTFLPYKIFIIDEVHMLSTSAFNALLKTLEEPPAHVVFILATTDIEKIPDTILSRCQRFTFAKMEKNQAIESLKTIVAQEKRTIDDEVLEKIFEKSEGGMRDAVSLLDQVLGIEDKHITLQNTALLLPQVRSEDIESLLKTIEKQSLPEIFDQLKLLGQKDTNFIQFTDELISTLRKILIEKIQKKSEIFSLNPEKIFSLIDILLRRRGELRTSPIPTLPLEMGFFEWTLPKTETLPVSPKQGLSENIKSTIKLASVSSSPTPDKKQPQREDSQLTIEPSQIETTTEPKFETQSPTNLPLTTTEVPSFDPGLEFSAIQKKWSEVLGKIEKDSPSLIFILRMAELIKLEADTLILSVPFSFHKNKLSDKTNQRKIEATLSEVYGCKLHFDIVVTEKSNLQNDAQELALMIGGQVV